MGHRGMSFGVVVSALLLTACGGAGEQATSTTEPSAAATMTAAAAGESSELSVVDPWVKATAGAEEATMTAVFAVVTNSSSEQRTIVAATTTASPRAELHEMSMVDGAMVMRKIDAGIVVPAGQSVSLEPGGLHVMVLDVAEEIAPGDEVDVTLTFDNGASAEFTALAKDFAGANEEYESDGGMDMTAEMSGAPQSDATDGG